MDVLQQPPLGVLLVARLYTQGAPGLHLRCLAAARLRQWPPAVTRGALAKLPHLVTPAADAELLPPGADSRLVGTVALSFARSTREDFPTQQPPDAEAYLSNMAVDPAFRRWTSGEGLTWP